MTEFRLILTYHNGNPSKFRFLSENTERMDQQRKEYTKIELSSIVDIYLFQLNDTVDIVYIVGPIVPDNR